MESQEILYSKKSAVARVVLNRPGVINAYNMRMRDELYQVMEAVRDDPDVRVAVLSGAGDRGFCAGADLIEFGTAPSQVVARRVRWERDVWGVFLSITKPLVAALHGYVLGSGVEIACLCDIRIASEDAVFGLPEVALGMIPAAGGTQTVPRMIGAGAALDLMLTNRRINANEAKRSGLVHRIVNRDELYQESDRLARELSMLDPGAVAAAKSALLEGTDLPLGQGLALEARLTSRLMSAPSGFS